MSVRRQNKRRNFVFKLFLASNHLHLVVFLFPWAITHKKRRAFFVGPDWRKGGRQSQWSSGKNLPRKGGNNEEIFNLFAGYVYMYPCQGGNRNNKLVC